MAEDNGFETLVNVEGPATPGAPGAAVAEPPPAPRTEPARKAEPRRQPPYHVVLHDDDAHTVEYVVLMMGQLFRHPAERGMHIAVEVHTRGRAVVLTTTKEHAELKRDQIHAFGPGKPEMRCKGSMRASIAPASDEI